MGAWGISVFDNDDAADFSSEFDQANSATAVTRIIEDALDAVLDETVYVEAREGATGFAAAALVVAWEHSELLGDTPYPPRPWPKSAEHLPLHLKTKAAAVLDRMHEVDGNEFAELWADAGRTLEFHAELARWRSHLP